MELMKKFVSEESGQGMVEYGLIIAVVAIMLIAGLGTMRDEIIALLLRVETALSTGQAP